MASSPRMRPRSRRLGLEDVLRQPVEVEIERRDGARPEAAQVVEVERHALPVSS